MIHRVLLFIAILIASWCIMLVTHECGHIVGGWCCGGTLVSADLLPWHLPYSIFIPDPHPLMTLWSGPVLGVAVPVLCALIVRRRSAWLIAYFCMLANGTYLAVAWFTADKQLDTAKLLAHGAHPITVGTYCSLTIGVGYSGFRRSCVQWFASRSHDLGEATD